MSLIIDADGEYLSGSGVTLLPSGCTEATFAIWVKRASASSTYQSYAYAGRNAAESYGSFWVAHNGNGPDCFAVPAGLQARAASTAGANSTSWQVLVFTYKNGVATKTYAGIVGGSLVAYTGETPVSAYNADVDNIRIGLGMHTADGWYPRARLAHCALWDKELTATEAGELFNGGSGGAGKNPQAIQNANLKFYSPLNSDATVTVGGISLSPTGTLTYDGADNPNVEAYGGDTTAPTLSSASVSSVAATTATGNVTTNEGNGTLYSVVSTSATAPSAAQIQAGQNHTGATAVWSGNQVVSSTGAKTFSITGLTASTAYYAHFQHKDSANNNSTVVTSAQFTTTAATQNVTVANASQVNTVTEAAIYQATANGTLTTAPLKNNSRTLLANISGWTVDVKNATTNALVVRVTGLTTSALGVLTVTDPLIVTGTDYAFEPSHATYGRILPVLTAT